MSPRLDIRGLSVFYGGAAVVHQIDLVVHEGEMVTLLGANGAGKTSTLRAISRQGAAATGTIHFEGRDTAALSAAQVARAGIAHVPEGRGTFGELSVSDNLRVGAITRKDKRAVQHDMQKYFERFPKLGERASQPAGTLSGGEQQMLAIARALMARPRLLLLDEPSFGVAPRVTQEIYDMLGELRQEGLTALVVEQNADLALRVADRAYVLDCGRVTVSGAACALRLDDTIRQSYIGH